MCSKDNKIKLPGCSPDRNPDNIVKASISLIINGCWRGLLDSSSWQWLFIGSYFEVFPLQSVQPGVLGK